MAENGGSDKIALPKMAELVAERIRGDIARGDFRPGDSLPSETALMERFGVARPTMREAIRILESDSLIATRRGSQSGPKVLPVDVSVLARRAGLLLQMQGATIDDLEELQFTIEPVAARLAAKRRTKADITAMRDLIERGREVVDMPDFAPIAAQFHVVLLRASKNKAFTMVGEVLNALTLELFRGQMVSLRHLGDKLVQPSLNLYERVTDKIEARDAAGAERVWSREKSALHAALHRLGKSERKYELYQT